MQRRVPGYVDKAPLDGEGVKQSRLSEYTGLPNDSAQLIGDFKKTKIDDKSQV